MTLSSILDDLNPAVYRDTAHMFQSKHLSWH